MVDSKVFSAKLAAGRARRLRLLLPLLGVAVACGVGITARTSAGPEPRTLRLTARGMAFYLEGDPTPNPTLVVRRGEEVRIELRNDDGGMKHDFAVESLAVASDVLRGAGEETSIVVEAPDRPGETEYVCTLHASMMRGKLRVV